MKYIEISRNQAKAAILSKEQIEIVAIDTNNNIIQKEIIQAKEEQYTTLDDYETTFITKLPDNVHVSIHYYEVWC